MQTDYRNIKKRFEKSFDVYEENAVVQKNMAHDLVCELLKYDKSFENILELGSGTGVLTKEIKSKLEFKNYYANDLVEKSKIYIEKIVPNVNFVCGNALKIKIQKKFDLVISNAMFQWFENLEKSAKTIRTNIKNGGILAFSTFSPENFCEITKLTGLSLNYKTEQEISEILSKLGLDVLLIKGYKDILEFDTPLELLAHMKKTGVNSLSVKNWTITEVKDFCDKFKEKYEEISGTPWEEGRNDDFFGEDNFVETAKEVLGMSEEAARNLYQNKADQYSLTVEDFAVRVREYIEAQGKNNNLVFMVDEVGQYIGNSSELILNLQSIVQCLGTECNGHAWVVVTSQEAIDSVAKNLRANDFFIKMFGCETSFKNNVKLSLIFNLLIFDETRFCFL